MTADLAHAQQWRIRVGDSETTALFEPATAPPPASTPRGASTSQRALYVFAHGAGGHMDDRGMLALARELRARGVDVVRFNFIYRAKGSKAPDRMPQLEACMEAVIERARAELHPDRLIIGGRSMGGRTATMLAARNYDCDGLLLFAYPLHPANKPEKLRDAHLPKIEVPVLCFNGTRDALCRRDLMESALRTVTAPWRMHWIEGADHSFHVLKSSGRSDDEVVKEIAEECAAWLASLQ